MLPRKLLLLLALAAPAALAEEHLMKRVAVMDEHGFEKPLPAVTMLMPKEWKFESSVLYGQAPCGELLQVSFRSTSPDQLSAMELFPAYTWQWADDQMMRQGMQQQNQQAQQFKRRGCDLMQPMHAQDFVTKVVLPKVRPGAKLLKVEPMPDAEENVQKNAQQQQAQAQQMGLRQRVFGDTARARISYSLKGKEVEEWLTAVVVTRQTAMPSMRGQTSMYSSNATWLFSLRAPKGKLDEQLKLYKAIIASMRIQPEWQGRVAQVSNNIAQVRAKGESDRAKIRAQSAEDVRRIQNETYQNQQHAQDAQHKQFSQYIRGVESYKDPNSGQEVELSSQYGHAWSNGSGDYLLSDSPNFDPNAHLNGNWTQLQHVEPQ